jgi:cell division septum initiation protein DivIVA
LSDSPQEISLSLVAESADLRQSDEDFDELGDGLITSEERIATLQGELAAVVERETETARELDTRRELRATFERQLFEMREEAVRLMLVAASRTRDAMLAEAEESLEASRVDAEREARRITKTASDQANSLLAEAKREAGAILDDGRKRFGALEAEVADRVADLDTERQDLANQLSVMAAIYDDLQATLQLVAKTSIKELVEAKSSIAQLDPSAPNTPRRRSGEKQLSSDPDPHSA